MSQSRARVNTAAGSGAGNRSGDESLQVNKLKRVEIE